MKLRKWLWLKWIVCQHVKFVRKKTARLLSLFETGRWGWWSVKSINDLIDAMNTPPRLEWIFCERRFLCHQTKTKFQSRKYRCRRSVGNNTKRHANKKRTIVMSGQNVFWFSIYVCEQERVCCIKYWYAAFGR